MEMTAPSIMQLFDTTKEQRASFVNDIIVRLDEVNPLDLHLQVKCLESILKQLKDHEDYKRAIMDESGKYPGKKFTYRHAEITKTEVGTEYNYLACGDPVYDRLHADASGANDKLKEREKFLRSIPECGVTVTDQLTGETIILYPPQKTSTSTISVKLL